jgi:hypothetical protein
MSAWTGSITRRAYHFVLLEGVRIDEGTALKAAAGLTYRGCDSHFFRHFRCGTGSLCFRRSFYDRVVCVL